MKYLLILFTLTFTLRSSSETIKDYQESINKEIMNVVKKYYPKAKLEFKNGGIQISHDTMIFTVHGAMMTGNYYEQTRKEEGPQGRGFLLFIKVVEGPYQRQAVVPQTLRKPYWKTYINAPQTKNKKNYYWINLKFGHLIKKDFMKELFSILPQSKNPLD